MAHEFSYWQVSTPNSVAGDSVDYFSLPQPQILSLVAVVAVDYAVVVVGMELVAIVARELKPGALEVVTQAEQAMERAHALVVLEQRPRDAMKRIELIGSVVTRWF